MYVCLRGNDMRVRLQLVYSSRIAVGFIVRTREAASTPKNDTLPAPRRHPELLVYIFDLDVQAAL